jgi:hypothetical protein
MQTHAEIDRVWDASYSDDSEPLTEASIICYWSWRFSDLDDEAVKGDVAGAIAQPMLGVEFSTLSLNELRILRLSGYELPQPNQSTTHRQTFDA